MKFVPVSELLELSDSGVWGEEDTNNGISVLRSTNFNANGTLDLGKLTFRVLADRDKDRKLLQPGDILLEKSGGGPKQPVGRVCLYTGDSQPHAFGNFIARLRPNSEILSAYLFYFLWNFHQTGKTSYYQKQTTGLRNLELKRYLAINIPLPNIKEQRRIVDLLSRAEGIIRLRREAQKKASAIIPALFRDIFGDPLTNPKGWPVQALGDLIARGPTNGLYKHKSAYGSGTPILRIDAFYDGSVRDLSTLKRVRLEPDEQRRFALSEGDIVINRVNSPEYLGKSAIIPTLREPSVFESNMMRFSVDDAYALPEFVIALLQEPTSRRHFLANAKHAINQSSINQQDVKSLPAIAPPLHLQRLFVKLASAMQSIELQQQAALIRARQTFNSLLARTFSAAAPEGSQAMEKALA